MTRIPSTPSQNNFAAREIHGVPPSGLCWSEAGVFPKAPVGCPRLLCTLTGLLTLSFPRMPCGLSATRRLQKGSGAERRRRTPRRRWIWRPNCGKVSWNRWLSRSTPWPFRCNGTAMSSRGFFGRRAWEPWLPFLVLLQGWSIVGGEELSVMSTGRCMSILTALRVFS